EPWAYATIRRQSDTWGFNELEQFLAIELAGMMPEYALTFSEFSFARDLLADAAERYEDAGAVPARLAIVYNDNINLSAQLWIFLRRIVYDGWPVTSAELFGDPAARAEFLASTQAEEILFINPTDAALQDRTRPLTAAGDALEAVLQQAGIEPREIRNARGAVAFRIYRFKIAE
ncbi:hypothetical protein C4552_03405, partial [Candidatus Parcubacteria bacterium]